MKFITRKRSGEPIYFESVNSGWNIRKYSNGEILVNYRQDFAASFNSLKKAVCFVFEMEKKATN